MMLEHSRKCQCGRRTYLFGQCTKCLQEEHAQTKAEQGDATHEEEGGVPGAEDRRGGELDSSPGAGESDAQPRGARLVSGPPAGAVMRRLPGARPNPSPQRGLRTEHVLFINDTLVEKLLVCKPSSRDELWPYGPVSVKTWKYGQDLALPIRKQDFVYRTAFVIANTSDVLPLMQCVDVRWETSHRIVSTAWQRDQAFLTSGAFGLGAISSQLNEQQKAMAETTERWFTAEGPLRSHISLCMGPYKHGVMLRSLTNQSHDDLYWYISLSGSSIFLSLAGCSLGAGGGERSMGDQTRGKYGMPRQRFERVLGMAVAPTERISNLYVLWGRDAREDRKVLILFATRWMIYDRFDQFQLQEVSRKAASKAAPVPQGARAAAEEAHPRGVQPCGARPISGPPAGAAESPGPVPNMEYKKATVSL